VEILRLVQVRDYTGEWCFQTGALITIIYVYRFWVLGLGYIDGMNFMILIDIVRLLAMFVICPLSLQPSVRESLFCYI